MCRRVPLELVYSAALLWRKICGGRGVEISAFYTPNPLSRIFKNINWTSTRQQDKRVVAWGWIYLSRPVVKLYCHMIPGASCELPRNPCFMRIVGRDDCFVRNVFRGGSHQKRCDFKQSSKIESLMGTSIEYPFRTKQKISHHNPSVPPRLRGGPTRGVDLYFETNRFWVGRLGQPAWEGAAYTVTSNRQRAAADGLFQNSLCCPANRYV
jgi:hypothetical protein